MSKFLSLIIIAVFLLCASVFSGCGGPLSSIEEQQHTEFKVNNPNTSYFDVQKRIQLLKTSDNSTLLSEKSLEFDCSTYPKPDPIDYYLEMPEFYEDQRGWEKANAPLENFERYVTRLAELYVTTENTSYVQCLADVLSEWAERNSLLSFKYSKDNRQAWFAVEWTVSSAGLAYSIIRDSPSLQPEVKQKIETWLKKVANKQISYPGGSTSCCNNHAYWRGLEAAIVGVVTNDDDLFRFAIKKYISALKSMNKDGSFPLEMQRGERAIHYQNFAILPLVYIAEIASRQGYDLYDLTIDGKDLHLAVHFLLNAMEDPTLVKKYTKKTQDTSFIYKKRELNWMEPYNQRFHKKDIEMFLESRRPIYHRWSGGNSTLYFYTPEPQ